MRVGVAAAVAATDPRIRLPKPRWPRPRKIENMQLPTTLAVLALGAGLAAQGDLEAKLEKKLASPFLENADWVTDLGKAKARAKETGKVIFGYFTRSYSP